MNKVERTNSNRARDHLANERTYLAWMRTAIALMGFGVLIVRLRHLIPQMYERSQGWLLGLLFAFVGLLMVLLATIHYFHIQNAIEEDTYKPAGRWIIICTCLVILIGAGVLYYLLTIPVVPPSD